jgi:hypothetical protein
LLIAYHKMAKISLHSGVSAGRLRCKSPRRSGNAADACCWLLALHIPMRKFFIGGNPEACPTFYCHDWEQAFFRAISRAEKRADISEVSPFLGERSKGWIPKIYTGSSNPSVLASAKPSANPKPCMETELVFRITDACRQHPQGLKAGATL